MILDNASGHPEPSDFNTKSVKMVYLPPNTMSLIQPLDQGVIRTFKAHYTWYSMERIVNVMEENPDRTSCKSGRIEGMPLKMLLWKTIKSEPNPAGENGVLIMVRTTSRDV